VITDNLQKLHEGAPVNPQLTKYPDPVAAQASQPIGR
jgi:hypothetical protein